MKQNCCVLIPAYQPPEKFLEYAAVLRAARRKFCPHCRGHRWGAAGIHAGKLYSGKPAQPVRLPCGGRARSCRAADAAKALRRGRQRRLLPHWKVRHLAPPEGRIKSQCAFVPPLIRNRQISRRIKKHLWLSNRSWARDVHSFGILHSWGALAGKSCSAQASSIWLIAGAFRRTQSK